MITLSQQSYSPSFNVVIQNNESSSSLQSGLIQSGIQEFVANKVEIKSDLTLENIQNIYLKHFKEEFKKFNHTSSDIQVNLIKDCEVKFKNSKKLELADRTNFQVNFALDLSAEDFKKNKKVFDKEIGFFNFKITIYKSKQLDKEFKISYFSEISLEEKFQSYGLFNYIFKPYTETLKELNIDVDYLHVKSQKPFTASVYQKKGYQFTPETEEILSTNYEGKEAYLKDSSVSYPSNDTIEMFRLFNLSASVKTSMVDLETFLKEEG